MIPYINRVYSQSKIHKIITFHPIFRVTMPLFRFLGVFWCFYLCSFLSPPHPPNMPPFFCFGPGSTFRFIRFSLNVLCWQVATFIVQKILLDDVGLDYICTTAERFFAVGRVLGNMVTTLADQPSSRLLKHIIRCYLRLSDNPRLIEIYSDVF